MPDDAYWALGLGDSFVLVCPSLDIVAVRLGVGSVKSQLPGGDEPGAWGKRVEGFARLVVVAARTDRPGRAARPPYPPSPVIKDVKWAPAESIVRKAKGGDNWPITWADDGHLYTAYGDGNGFEPEVPDKLSLGFARVEGGPADFTGVNIRSASGEHKGRWQGRQEGQRNAHGRRRPLHVGAQRGQCPAGLVEGSCQDVGMERLDVHDELRLPDVPQLRQKLRRRPGRLCLRLLP